MQMSTEHWQNDDRGKVTVPLYHKISHGHKSELYNIQKIRSYLTENTPHLL
jgi:hypothetical protein